MNTQKTTTKKRYFPSSFLVIIMLMLIFIIISWIGYATSNTIKPLGIVDIASSIWHGFASKVEVILFVFAIGGTLGVMTKIKAIDAGMNAIVKKLGDKILILIPILMIIFGLGGTTFGMWEETIAFIPVLIPIFKKANYGAFTAILVILIGAGVGCLASTINPFAIGASIEPIEASIDEFNKTQHEINKLGAFTPGVGQGTRWLSFVIFEMVTIPMVMWIALRIKKGAIKVEGLNTKLIEERFSKVEDIEFTKKRKISLGLFILAFVLMIFFYLPWGDWVDNSKLTSFWSQNMWWLGTSTSAGFAKLGEWYFISVASLFFIITLIIFAINFKDFKSSEENCEEGLIKVYMNGIKDMVSVSMLIGVAAGLSKILTASGIGFAIANLIANEQMGLIAFGLATFAISLLLSALVPSTSGFAAAFMGIFATIAIKSGLGFEGISIAILGFIFANGLANFFTPTSAALMGYTAYAGVPYQTWIKQTWKIQLALLVTSIFLIIMFASIGKVF